MKTTQRKHRRRRQRGMTLIEIIVVITILALIAAAVSVAVIPQLDRAKVDTARLDISNIQSALKLYYAKKGNFPDTATGLRAVVEAQALDKIPVDPWGTEYVYMNEAGKAVITSYGRDKAPGGEGLDGDISNKDSEKK